MVTVMGVLCSPWYNPHAPKTPTNQAQLALKRRICPSNMPSFSNKLFYPFSNTCTPSLKSIKCSLNAIFGLRLNARRQGSNRSTSSHHLHVYPWRLRELGKSKLKLTPAQTELDTGNPPSHSQGSISAVGCA